MYKQVGSSLQGKLRRRGSHITLGVPIGLKDSIKRSEKKIVPDIKFSAFVEKWILDVLLNDEGSERSITTFFSGLDSIFDLFESITYCDAITSIAVFSRFHYPNVFGIFPLLFIPLKNIGKCFILCIFKSLGDMKSKGNNLKYIFILKTVVFFHVVKQRFFVSNVVILLKMVMDS